MNRSVVVYHYPCFDGVFSAFSHWIFLGKYATVPVKYLPLKVTLTEVEIATALKVFQPKDEVFFLDFIGPKGMIEKVCEVVDTVTLLDHHLTAKEYLDIMVKNGTLPKNMTPIVDMERSGAGISWDYFSTKTKHPLSEADSKRIHEMVLNIQDIDLWKHKLPESKEFGAGFGELKLEMSHELNPNIFEQLYTLNPPELITSGRNILIERQKLVDGVVASAVPMKVTYKTGDEEKEVNCFGVTVDEKTSLYRSEIGNQLAVKSNEAGKDPCALVCTEYEVIENEQPTKRMKVSFRSLGDFNTAAIAQTFGGGGHKNAASFTTTTEVYQKMFI